MDPAFGDGPAPPAQGATPSTPSPHSPRNIDVDLPSGASTATSAPATAETAIASSKAEVDGLEHQSRDFLLQRVRALEQQLRVRNSDCARLLQERKQLLLLKEKCESQKEMILALSGELDLARAQRESAMDAMEAMKRQQRDKEHHDRIAQAERAIYGSGPQSSASNANNSKSGSTNKNTNSSSPKSTALVPNIGRRNPGGTVVNTAAGPQLLFDSSDISSVGFVKNGRLPCDFLGGPSAQEAYLARYNGYGGGSGGSADGGVAPDGGNDESEDAQVRRVIDAAKDQAEMEAKYAEMENKEEEALMARIKALREGRK